MKTIFKAFILTNLLIGVSSLNAQNFEWAKSFGSSNIDRGRHITIDAAGNVYATGYFASTVDFNPGAGTANLTSAGGSDVYVLKIDASGNFLWAKRFGGSGEDFGMAIAIDASGNVYTTGRFAATVDFDPGAGTANRTSAGLIDIFVQKLDADGNFLWVKSFGDTSNDYGQLLCVDNVGNVYTAGAFRNTVDFDPGAGTTSLTTAGGEDIFVQKMDTDGNFIWAKSFTGSESDFANSISVDEEGNVYTTGYFRATVDFNPGAGTTNLSSAGNLDLFVHKMDTDGNFLWAKGCGSTGDDDGYSISVDASGNVYTTGFFEGTVDFNPGAGTNNLTSAGDKDIFVMKMDALGNFIWAKHFGDTSDDVSYSISTDASGNVYTTGYFQGDVDFDPEGGTASFSSLDSTDIFIHKMDTDGNFLWAKQIGGTSEEYGQAIAIDAVGNIYTTGRFAGMADFDAGSGTANLTSAGGDDIFVLKMSQPIVGMDVYRNSLDVSVYPNPSQGNVEITLGTAMQDVELMLTDIQGRVIFTRNYPSLFKTNIELPDAKGVYVLKLKAQDSTSTLRLVKE